MWANLCKYCGNHKARRRKQKGYVLVALSLGLIFVLGMAGMAVDIGRMYITKSEAQSFVDTASFAAALQLDGTAAGITRAQNAVANNPKKWEFQNDAFTNVTTQFATSSAGPWVPNPNPATNYYFAQVQTSVSLPMYLIGALGSPHSTIAAEAIAGRASTGGVPGGEFPFSPYTRSASPDNPNDPYGYQIGNKYTIRWGAPGNNTNCGTTDATYPNLAQNGQIRGYCCVAESAATLRQAIVGGATDPLTVGQPVPMDNGAKDTEMTAIANRVNEDTDTTSADYAAYLANGTGNGERVVYVAVNSGAPNYTNLGFAGFFLLSAGTYAGLHGNDSACAQYIGTYVQGNNGNLAPSGSGAYHIKLFQ